MIIISVIGYSGSGKTHFIQKAIRRLKSELNFEVVVIKNIHQQTGITKVILSGGTFQNKYMSENLLDLLTQIGFKAYMSQKIPVNDGGIALGQLAIAAKKLTLCV